MNANILPRIFVVLAVATALTGCVLRPYTRDARDPALAVVAPCYSGDICTDPARGYDGAGFAWAVDVVTSLRH
jgi:hypothetical protein